MSQDVLDKLLDWKTKLITKLSVGRRFSDTTLNNVLYSVIELQPFFFFFFKKAF